MKINMKEILLVLSGIAIFVLSILGIIFAITMNTPWYILFWTIIAALAFCFLIGNKIFLYFKKNKNDLNNSDNKN